MDMKIEKRRRAPRISAEINLKYKIIRSGTYMENENDLWVDAETRNINEYGIAITAKKELKESDVLRVVFTVEDIEINAFCDVVVVIKEATGRYHVGLEFQFINDFDFFAYMNYLRNRLREMGFIN